MIQTITVVGLASQKIIKRIEVPSEYDDDLSLMDFLRGKGITIASSCGGVGTCKKCLINTSLLSCQITLKDFTRESADQRVEISYL